MIAKALRNIDRRAIYLLVALALSIPLVMRYTVTPARMKSAESFFQLVEELQPAPGRIAFVALDFGPNTVAENGAQAEVVIEHLMRRRVPVALFSLYVQAEHFLSSIPDEIARKLALENPGSVWEYGKDWVNLGYRPGGALILQAIPKSPNLVELFKKDVRGNSLKELPAFRDVRGLESVQVLCEFTGLVGMFDTYVQFFQKKEYKPVFGHGCTSITIPEAFIYVDSGQLNGLLEGIAGAAWYSNLLQKAYPLRPVDKSAVLNTGLGVAHLVIIILIVLGNLSYLFERRKTR